MLRPRSWGTEKAHACQLNLKTSLDTAFRDCLVPSLRLGMPTGRLRLPDSRQSRFEVHFQPEARNEVLKGV
ncbi:MAG: hypothetical protein ACYT04_83460 [Nostoc sp.]